MYCLARADHLSAVLCSCKTLQDVQMCKKEVSRLMNTMV